MFDKFGELESWEKLNELAVNLLKEGDSDSLKALCEENGIDYEDVMDAPSDSPITAVQAALGRIKVEQDNDKQTPAIIYDFARTLVDKDTAPLFTVKGKRVKGVYEDLRNIAQKNKTGNCGVACGTDRELRDIILKYYRRAS